MVDADALGAAGADGVVAPEVDARITKRVLRVHTGGEYASSVSLPVPRSHVGGLGGRPEGGGRQGDAGSRGGDRSGARDNGGSKVLKNKIF